MQGRHVVVGKEHRLSFLTGSSVRGTSIIKPEECGYGVAEIQMQGL